MEAPSVRPEGLTLLPSRLCLEYGGCQGVEFHSGNGRCELWIRPDGIQASRSFSPAECYRLPHSGVSQTGVSSLLTCACASVPQLSGEQLLLQSLHRMHCGITPAQFNIIKNKSKKHSVWYVSVRCPMYEKAPGSGPC